MAASRSCSSPSKPAVRFGRSRIISAALDAFGQGAGRFGVNPPAVESFRRQILPYIRSALERPDWHENWQRESVYLLAQVPELKEQIC